MQFNEPNPLAASRLGIAAHIGDENSLLMLLKKGSRIDVGDNRGWNAIHEAAAANHIGCLKLLLKKGRKYVNQKTMEGETALTLACCREASVDLVRVLLDNGADVNMGNNEDFTPLHQACKNGKLEIAEVLIEAGANLNAINYNMWTPLHFAVDANCLDVMMYLISKGADVMIQDECGRTPLFLVSDLEIAQPLIKFYDFVDTRAKDGATALMIASQGFNVEIVQELLKRGADPNLAAHDHTMAIHLAVHAGSLRIVELLLEVTSKEAILEHCKNPKITVNSSLCCLAIDCENYQVLEALIESDLGNDILHLPIYRPSRPVYDVSVREPSHEFNYRYSSSISFLLENKLTSLEDDAILYLALMLKHGFPVNPVNSKYIPPLVAICLEGDDKFISLRCVDILMVHGADIDFTTKCAGVPDALLAACLSGKCSLLLKLLRLGSSGVPDDLLRYILVKKYLEPIQNMRLGKMVNCLLELGVTKPNLYKLLQSYIHASGSYDLTKDMSKGLAEFQMCSLQQLSRIAVRKHLRQPLTVSLNQLTIPKCIKDYLIYK